MVPPVSRIGGAAPYAGMTNPNDSTDVVQAGETTLLQVAKRMKVDPDALFEANPQIADPLPSALILVADDYAPWRDRARCLLQEHPEWQVAEACDGLEAVQTAIELHPDLILLDIGMPILNGIETARSIREAIPDSKIIFVTANSDADTKAAILAAGAEAYVLKANAATGLLPAIAAALRNGRH